MVEIIKTENLTKVYGKLPAVDSVSLSVKQGEIFGFLGLNGAGKTTTIRMLLGMIKPSSGACYLKGKKVNPGNLEIWKDVGYIVETPHSYPELTVKDNLEIFRLLRGIEDKNTVDWIIEKLRLGRYASKKVKHLSLGNAQRLGIAKALIHKPEILILDEPTNGLDPAGVVEVRELLKDLAKNFGTTILMSSHKLDEISRIATKIAIIHEGKLIKEIASRELEGQLRKTLLIDGRNRKEIARVLLKSGYSMADEEKTYCYREGPLQIFCKESVNHPEKLATLLVNAGHPPTLLKVEKEDLEKYFLREIREMGGE